MTAAASPSYPVGKLLILAALVTFVLAFVGVTAGGRDLVALGLAFLAAGLLV